MDYYENHPKSKAHIINLNRLNNIWKSCDICKDDINKSSWNRHVKKHAGFAYSLLCKHKSIFSTEN